MKKLFLVLMLVVMAAGVAMAQVTSPTGDVLGAHLIYGRGCAGCHAPHSGAFGNGGTGDANSGVEALWGQDMSPMYAQTLSFGDGASYQVTLPNYGTTTINGIAGAAPTSAHDPYFGIIACLSCHDGNLTSVAFMKGSSFETVTINGKSFNPPTKLGADGTTAGNYHNDHPIGPSATVGCGGQYNWDCTYANSGTKGTYTLGPNGQAFAANYLDPTKGGVLANTQIVNATSTGGGWITCTTCHDQHSMVDFAGTYGGYAGTSVTTATAKHFTTSFFVRGWYQPGLTSTSNNAAQFCRQCHGGEANEMHNLMNIPTT